MTSIFDGLTGIIAGVLGKPDILWSPVGHDPVSVESVFRHVQVEVAGADGESVMAMAPTWRVPLDPDWPRIPKRGDTIEPGDGETYRILWQQPSGSPAADHFLIFALEKVT